MRLNYLRLQAALLALLVWAVALAPAQAQYSDQQQWVTTAGGSANALTLAISNYPSNPAAAIGVPLRFKPGVANTGPATVVVNGGTSKNLRKPSPSGPIALSGGELISGQVAEIIYDGTSFTLTSSINSTLTNVVLPPQGYLTPCNVANSPSVTGCTAGQMGPSGDVTGVSALYYGPWFGNQVPIYNGSNMILTSFSELTLTIPASRLANTIYDVCVFNNGGTVTAVFSVAWTTSTAGGGARGTGAGTAQIALQSGIWTNAVAITGAVNGASTFNIPANQCTVVGTVLIGGTNGQVSFTKNYGFARVWSAFNFYNRQPVLLTEGDSSTAWLYNTTTLRASNNNSVGNNNLTFVLGLPDQSPRINFLQGVGDSAGTANNPQIAIAKNGVGPSFSGLRSSAYTAGNGGAKITGHAVLIDAPFIGSNVYQSLEGGGSTGGQFFGTASDMLFTAEFNG